MLEEPLREGERADDEDARIRVSSFFVRIKTGSVAQVDFLKDLRVFQRGVDAPIRSSRCSVGRSATTNGRNTQKIWPIGQPWLSHIGHAFSRPPLNTASKTRVADDISFAVARR